MSARNLTLSLLAIALLPLSYAGDVTFKPELRVGREYSSNLGFTTDDNLNDSSTTYGVDLPWRFVDEKGSSNILLSGSYFQQDDFDSLDRFEWGATLASNRRMSERTSWGISVTARETEAQGDPAALDIEELFLFRRTKRNLYGLSFNASHDITKRWVWRTSFVYAGRRIEDIEDFDAPGADSAAAEDRDTYAARVSFEHRLSPRTTFGPAVGFSRLELEQSGDADVLFAGFAGEHKVSQTSNLGFSAGATRATGTALNPLSMNPDAETTGAQASLDYRRTFRTTTLTTQFSFQPTAGGNIPGAAEQGTLSILLASNASKFINWNTSLRGSRRDPADDGPVLNAYTAGLGLSGALTRTLALSTAASWLLQDSEDPAVRDREVFSWSVNLVYAPKGRI